MRVYACASREPDVTDENDEQPGACISARGADRRRYSAPGHLEAENGFTGNVFVTDISLTGARAHGVFYNFVPGILVMVGFQGLGPMRGTVRWVDGRSIGIAFDKPLHVSVLDWLTPQS